APRLVGVFVGSVLPTAAPASGLVMSRFGQPSAGVQPMAVYTWPVLGSAAIEPCHANELMLAASVNAFVTGVSVVEPGSAGWKCRPSSLQPYARPPTVLPLPKHASQRYER